jgi:hypothetical protein
LKIITVKGVWMAGKGRDVELGIRNEELGRNTE